MENVLPPRTKGSNLIKLRSEEHTSELQSQSNLVCRLLLEKKKNNSHMMLQDKNSDQISAVIQKCLLSKGLSECCPPQRSFGCGHPCASVVLNTRPRRPQG